MNLTNIYHQHTQAVLLGIILIIIGIITFGLLIYPEIFYDQWIWKHYVGPTVADSLDHPVSHNGVTAHEGYTLLAEITYGLLLVIAIYGIYKLLRRLHIDINWSFFLSLLPIILYGPISRVLEDTGYFSPPLIYFFISPLIYVQITAYTLFFIILGFYLQKKQRKNNVFLLAFVFLIFDIIYTLLWFTQNTYCAYPVNPLVIHLFSAIALILPVFRYLKQRHIPLSTTLFSGSIFILLPTIYLIIRWIAGYRWNTAHGVYPLVFLFVVSVTLLITTGVYLIAWYLKKHGNKKIAAAYMMPLSITMIFSHLLDGITSYIGLFDPLNMGFSLYVEKHPIPDFFMHIWGPLFPIIKLLLPVFIIYVLYVSYKEVLKEKPVLIGILVIGIIILGLAPSLRDLLRIAIGV